MGIITVVFKSREVEHHEVNDIETALSFDANGWVKITKNEYNMVTFNNDEIGCIRVEKWRKEQI
ncbi:hypothetical protein [Listeria monocytogenes]|uniref:hypothetical protein n=1 Tax=Listeria monocytogenes TaxID=1639 RepID=UPI0011EF61DB|nr:hypothetical protein [Listeria monocytogenes]TYU25366.1 hypothetical protein FZW91_02465 [Listeria monocytogenes]TYU32106.1 hypothetical protein FZW87_14010 [Listeria monocytogenes]